MSLPLKYLWCLLLWPSLVWALPQQQQDWQLLRSQIRETKGFRLGSPQQFQMLPDGRTVLFLRAEPPSTAQELFAFDRETKQERKLFDLTQLDQGGGQISAEERALRERLRMQSTGISFYSVDPAGERLLIPYRGKLYTWNLKTSVLTEIAKGQGPVFQAQWSPDGRWVAYVRAHNLYVAPAAGGPEIALTQGGSEEKTYGLAEFVAQEELGRQEGFWWSPDSQHLLLEEVNQAGVERLSLSDPAHPQIEAQRPFYPRPGKPNVKTRWGIVSVQGGTIQWIDRAWPTAEYVAVVQWESGHLNVQLLDREQKHRTLLEVDPKTLKAKILVEEHDAAWVHAEAGYPRWLSDQRGFLWKSEQQGAAVLELRDSRGGLLRSLTASDFGFQQLLGLDPQQKQALLLASKLPEASAVFKLDLQTGEIRSVKELGDGQVHGYARFPSPLYVLRAERLNGDEHWQLRSWSDDREDAIASHVPAPLRKAHVEIRQLGRDAVRVSIVRPSYFQAKQRYPAIEQVYGGPGSQMVKLSGRAYLGDQVLADALGAIVIRMDTRGTPGRGRDWERALAGKFGSLPVGDHSEIWKDILKAVPEIDPKRIGVTGWSYGGYFAAYAALWKPELYRVAVVGAPPVDWLDYDSTYTERYLGLPEREEKAYKDASLLDLIARTKEQSRVPSPMLIFHGTADDNVFFLNSLKFVDALERQGYPYEFVPLVGMTHMVSDTQLDERRFQRTLAFFAKYLKKSS